MPNRAAVLIFRKRILAAWPLSGLYFFLSCTESFFPPSEGYEDLLVVSGLITDASEPYTIRISRSFPLSETKVVPVTGASVSVSDDIGGVFFFEEENGGIYRSNPAEFTGKVGLTYTLEISFPGEEVYRSQPVLLKPSPGIDTVYFALDQRYNAEKQKDEKGILLYLNSSDEINDVSYFRWEFEETWETAMPLEVLWEYQTGEITPTSFERKEYFQRCWGMEKSAQIILNSTFQLSQGKISAFPFHFVPNTDFRLRTLYHIRLKQYALSKDGYQYWRALEKTTETLGTLFDPNPMRSQATCIGRGMLMSLFWAFLMPAS